MQLQSGKVWDVGKLVDGGGFGRVYTCSSDYCENAVAKFVPKEPGADRELLFEELGNARNVVPILDRGETEEAWVLIMPRATMSLRQHLNESAPLALDEAISIITEIATGLSDLSDRVVHRDLKPENVLCLDGNWCLADFGIARYAEASTAIDTHKYAMTAPYAAPEQWRFEHATAATDIYSLGVIAYELLTGARPFHGPAREDFREQHMHEIPIVANDLPIPIASLISECLIKAPAARPSASNFLTRVERFATSPMSSAIQRLQEVNQSEVQRQSEKARQTAQEQTEVHRRNQLYDAAKVMLEVISEEIPTTITASASQAIVKRDRDGGWSIRLGSAQLELIAPLPAHGHSWGNWEAPSVDVIAYSAINLDMPPNLSGYRGRGHSLWFCNAGNADEYGWYEIAFMNNPLMDTPSPSRNPYALNPGERAAKAL